MTHESIKAYLPENVTLQKIGRLYTYQVAPEILSEYCGSLYYQHHLSLKIITAKDERKEGGNFRIFYVFGVPRENIFLVPYIEVGQDHSFPSVVAHLHQASLYERLIKEMFGLTPVGHPDSKPVVIHDVVLADKHPLRKDFVNKHQGLDLTPAPYEFAKIGGEGIYEVPVGPVHAGIIEPGHFRFSMAGEEIVGFEPRLGFVHKGTEKLFEQLSLHDQVKLSERVAGDTAFSHSVAFTQAVEGILGVTVPDRARYIRVVLSEIERLANHLNDVGFIMFDTGHNGAGAHGVRLRERMMQLAEYLTGHRFLRGVNTVGGLLKDPSEERLKKIGPMLADIEKDFLSLLNIADNSNSFFNRLEGTGKVTKTIARDHGAVGVAARATGLTVDARLYFPYAAYDEMSFGVATERTGDVYARYRVRVKEILSSFQILKQALAKMPSGPVRAKNISKDLPPNSAAVGISEGWRGEVVYFVHTDAEGRISRVAVRDPSFINWQLTPYAALSNNVLLDFPLINKSFNLSYTGNDC